MNYKQYIEGAFDQQTLLTHLYIVTRVQKKKKK